MILWLTGLSGSGKTTIAKAIQKEINDDSKLICIDGDVLRQMFLPLGFTKQDRTANLCRTVTLVKILSQSYEYIVCSFISPYADIRNFIEIETGCKMVWVKCSIEECIKRDPKGLYGKAITGEIPNFTGISDPYEEPENPDLILDTEHESVEECVKKALKLLKGN